MKYNVGDIIKCPWGQLGMITEHYIDTYMGYVYKVRFLGRTGTSAFIEKDLSPLLEDV
jgi:hypothetical protein